MRDFINHFSRRPKQPLRLNRGVELLGPQVTRRALLTNAKAMTALRIEVQLN